MKRLVSMLIDMALWFLDKVAYIVLHVLGWRFTIWTGKITGNILYFFDYKKREITKKELSLLLGDRFKKGEIEDITKRSFENYYKRMMENLIYGSLNKKILKEMIRVEGIEHLNDALLRGRGVILLLSHFGSFLLPLPFLGFLGYKVNQLAGRQVHSSLAEEKIWKWRKRGADNLPVNFIQVEQFLRPVYMALKNNEIIVIAFDGREGTNWVTVNFLCRKALFSNGPFMLARRTGATIIPTFMIRTEDGTHRLILEQPFRLSERTDEAEALHCDTKQFAELFAHYVDRFPCHFGLVLYKLKKEHEMRKNTPLFAEAQ